jgi:hypothetical protein
MYIVTTCHTLNIFLYTIELILIIVEKFVKQQEIKIPSLLAFEDMHYSPTTRNSYMQYFY